MTGKLPNGCDNSIDAGTDPGRTIKVVPKQNRQMLADKQVVNYYSYCEKFLKWLLHIGKSPEKAKRYLPYTVYKSGYRAAAFNRWVWNEDEKYRLSPGAR